VYGSILFHSIYYSDVIVIQSQNSESDEEDEDEDDDNESDGEERSSQIPFLSTSPHHSLSSALAATNYNVVDTHTSPPGEQYTK